MGMFPSMDCLKKGLKIIMKVENRKTIKFTTIFKRVSNSIEREREGGRGGREGEREKSMIFYLFGQFTQIVWIWHHFNFKGVS